MLGLALITDELIQTPTQTGPDLRGRIGVAVQAARQFRLAAVTTEKASLQWPHCDRARHVKKSYLQLAPGPL